MTEDRSNPDSSPSFSSSAHEREQPPGSERERPWESESPPDGPSLGDRSSFALDMARMWVKENQKATMLGAFAVGVFVGALIRD